MHCLAEHLLYILIQRYRRSHNSIMMRAVYAVKMLCKRCTIRMATLSPTLSRVRIVTAALIRQQYVLSGDDVEIKVQDPGQNVLTTAANCTR